MITPRPYQSEAVKAILDAVKRGVRRQLVSLPTGCHATGTKILMYDGSLKPVEEIAVGDILMGPDSTPRCVLRLVRGSGEMYKITPIKGEPFIVNGDHVLSLKKSNERSERSGRVYPSTKPGVCNITVKNYNRQSKRFKHLHKLYRVGVEFPVYTSWFAINPYFMGVLLGDGGFSNNAIGITTPDWEIVQEVKSVAEEHGLDVRHEEMPGNKASNYFLVTKERRASAKFSNPIREELRDLGLLGRSSGEKFIPASYKAASRRDRLELLAGLIDTDGSNNQCGGFEYSTKSQQLAEDVLFVARSLGLAAYESEKRVNGVVYYRLTISGGCSIIPTRIERKRAPERRQIKDPLVSGFSVSTEGIGEYFGFTVDKDNLYVMGDFTVTHNCGKTIVFALLAKLLNVPTLILAHREELLAQARAKIRMVDPQADVGILQAEEDGGLDARICVASIQTASRPRRLQALKARGYELCIVDEAHHASADSYETTLRELGFLSDDPRRLLVGVTATAYRGDGVALGAIFDEVVYERTIMAMISGGYLTDALGISVTTETDLSGIHTRMGDFVTSELSWALNTPQRNALIAQAYRDNASDRRAVAFCVDVAHSHDLAQAFRSAGVSCEPIWGDMDREARRRTLSDYAAGKIQVVTNCSVLTEGWDDPATSAILLARPTKSPTLYCLDSETEILTKTGWKRGGISKGEEVAAFDIFDGTISWQPTLATLDRMTTEEEHFVTITTPAMDIRVTDQHRMVFRTRRRDSWDFDTAEAVARYRDGVVIPTAGQMAFPGAPLSDDEIRFIGWVMTDGCINKRTGAVQISQKTGRETCIEIDRVIKACGLKFGLHVEEGPTNYARHRSQTIWTISKGKPRGRDKHLSGWGHLEPYLSKDFSRALLETLDERQFDILLETVHFADGAKQAGQPWERGSYHISKGNRVFIENLQIACILRGWMANVSICSTGRAPLYTLHAKKQASRQVGSVYDGRPTFVVEEKQGEERCWCVETKAGTIVTRRNGKVAIVGNCQMVGRGLRTYPGKADCLVIDFADTVGRHSLCGFATLAGLPMMRHKSGETLSEAVERFDMAEDWKRERMGQVRKEAVDLFERSAFTWTPVAGGHFRLTAGDGRYIWLRNMPEGYSVLLIPTEGEREVLSEAPLPMGYAQGVAEDWVRLHGVGVLVERDAKWRRKPATEKQLELLRKWAVPHDPDTITAGEASGLIDMEMARAQNRREEPASHKQEWFIRVKLGKKDLPEGLTKGQATRIIAQAQREKKGVA